MPGLAVILSPTVAAQPTRDLERMVATLRHEPFYTTGTYADPDLGFYIGWACRPDANAATMPVRNERGNLLLFFHGEHLEDNASNADTTGSTAVLRLFERHGHDALPLLNGWFHGVLVDREQKTILIFNDRFGMQRLHVAKDGVSTLFSSEAKALLAVRPALRQIDSQGLAEFLSCGCVLENRGLFKGVTTLPAATALNFRQSVLESERAYFTPAQWESQPKLSEPEFLAALRKTLPTAVDRCLRSPAAIGMSLTGGFDTRLIMACLQSRGAVLPCYTFGGMYRDCFDVKIARSVARLCRCPHKVLALNQGFLEAFPILAEQTVAISDGTLGATNAYELYLNRLARHIAPIRLTGSYGSEVMRGARAFKAVPLTRGLLHADFEPHLQTAIYTFNAISPGHPVSFSVFKQAPWYYANRLAVEQSQVAVRTPFMDKDFVGLFYRQPALSMTSRQLARQLIAEHSPALAGLPTDTGNCSFLRHHWAQFLFKADYCYKSGMPQWLEKVHHLAGPLSPEPLLIGRHRFAHFRVWFRKHLGPYLRTVLLDPRALRRSYFSPRFVESMIDQHVHGERNHTDDLERVLTLELTCRQFIDN